jgi:hypothetical protein
MAFAPVLLGALAGGGAALGGATAATAVAIGGTVLAGIGQYQQAALQSQIARNNQKAAYANAEAASAAAQEKQKRSDYEYAALLGQQEAAQGASGLDILGASQLRTRALTARTRGIAATDIRRAGERDVGGYLGDAQNFGLSAKSSSLQGTIALGEMVAGVGKSVNNDPKLNKSLVGGAKSLVSRIF